MSMSGSSHRLLGEPELNDGFRWHSGISQAINNDTMCRRDMACKERFFGTSKVDEFTGFGAAVHEVTVDTEVAFAPQGCVFGKAEPDIAFCLQAHLIFAIDSSIDCDIPPT